MKALLLSLLCLSLGACALFPPRDPLVVQVAGINPATGADLEWRLLVQLRVQNPNRDPIDYSGVALALQVNGQPLASGVSPAQGTLAGYSEALISVPVTVSAFSVLRQAVGLASLQVGEGMPYRVDGKLDTPGWSGAVRFTDSGKLDTRLLSPQGPKP
ncbi:MULTISPECIES: LEA type 2 family protein [Pseudomonas]|uniref:Water stress and hypersensitive response domain-containing protein n=1 Tax=Pseudomonas quercus TaxID=2722792 RepID=A0ABX0YAW9_9PSED|nr:MULTISPECIES: LEA type 2 family protein [Pseudomonas]MBF7140902.1 LEA type 2 family protein [Pseudomonas sp. LY10J]NJO99436.1 hypothetical protein [Pseudomonas quercus]